jgi:hypothetical protein
VPEGVAGVVVGAVTLVGAAVGTAVTLAVGFFFPSLPLSLLHPLSASVAATATAAIPAPVNVRRRT